MKNVKTLAEKARKMTDADLETALMHCPSEIAHIYGSEISFRRQIDPPNRFIEGDELEGRRQMTIENDRPDPDDEGRRMDAWMDGPTGFQPKGVQISISVEAAKVLHDSVWQRLENDDDTLKYLGVDIHEIRTDFDVENIGGTSDDEGAKEEAREVLARRRAFTEIDHALESLGFDTGLGTEMWAVPILKGEGVDQ